MSEEWGPWVEHDGRGCPDIVGLDVECKVERDRDLPPTLAEDCETQFSRPWLWAIMPWPYKIIAYRIRKQRALRDLIEMVESLPEPSRPYGRPVEVVS
nr:hypothetical protein [uncultured Celeribacter sp.]